MANSLRAIVVSILAVLIAPAAAAETALQDLATLGRVWGFAKHAHPYMGQDDFGWDNAGIRAIRRTLQDPDDETFSAIINEMLSVLDDPATHVAPGCSESSPAEGDAFETADGRLYIPPGSMPEPETLLEYERIIVDLRPGPGRCTSSNAAGFPAIAPYLFHGSITAPPHQKLAHEGYRSQDPTGATQTVYSSRFVTEDDESFSGSGSKGRHTTFIVDRSSSLPRVAEAMILKGHGTLISVGPYIDLTAGIHEIPLGNGHHARIRTSRSTRALRPLVTLPADAGVDSILRAAPQESDGTRRRGVRSAQKDALEYRFEYEELYSEMKFPAVEYRILAAYRYWNVIHFFYGYHHLIDPWGPRLEQIIEILMNAEDQRDYELALREITLFVPDGHSWARTAASDQRRGAGAPPFQTLPAEGKPVVTSITHESATAAGIRLGDELLAVDGRPIEERLEDLRGRISAATDGNREFRAISAVPRGPDGSEAVFRFRRPDGFEYETTVTRRKEYGIPRPPRQAWRRLENNIGYVDLSYLEIPQIGAMFRDLARTRAIIFDNRGYPRGTFHHLGQRLNVTGSSAIAQLHIPYVVGGEIRKPYKFHDIGNGYVSPYRGKTFMLIDERTQSQAEHTALTFEAVADTTFVGTPTSGSNGNISWVGLPGGNFIMFTGMDVRHADGRQLQRVGIQPDVRVEKTISGVAAGRDEVLEKAIELASE